MCVCVDSLQWHTWTSTKSQYIYIISEYYYGHPPPPPPHTHTHPESGNIIRDHKLPQKSEVWFSFLVSTGLWGDGKGGTCKPLQHINLYYYSEMQDIVGASVSMGVGSMQSSKQVNEHASYSVGLASLTPKYMTTTTCQYHFCTLHFVCTCKYLCILYIMYLVSSSSNKNLKRYQCHVTALPDSIMCVCALTGSTVV